MKNNPEVGLTSEKTNVKTVVDQLPVAGFKNMQVQLLSGKHYDTKWEYGYKICHQ